MTKTDIVFDIETSGLDPTISRTGSIAVKTEEEEQIFVLQPNKNKNEKDILQDFWDYLRAKKYFRLIGFNSIAFDIFFLNLRSLLHGVEVVDVRGNHIDLRLLLNYGQKYKNGTLEHYAKFLGLEGKYKGLNGYDVNNLIEQGDIEELKRYAMQDVRITFEIYKKAKEIGLL